MGVLVGLMIISPKVDQNVEQSEQQLPLTVGSPMKDFTLHNVSGQPITISHMKGKPLVVNFWATWCAPCREEMPLLEQAAFDHKNELNIIGVNFGEKQDLVQSFVNENKITFHVVLDETGSVADEYFVRNYPMTFFFDKNGILQAQHIGQLNQEILDRYLALIGTTR